MSDSVRHKFRSLVADAGDPDEVGPNEWNDDHEILERVVGDARLLTWVDRTDLFSEEGLEAVNATTVVVNDVGPNGENVLQTQTNTSPYVFSARVPPFSYVKVDLYARPKQGGGSEVRIHNGSSNLVIVGNATADAWYRIVRIVRADSTGNIRLAVSWQHQLANIRFTLLGPWHLFDSWLDGAGTTSDMGFAFSNVTRTAAGAPDGGAKLTTAAGAGPNTIVTYTNLPVGAFAVIDMVRDPVAGGSTYFQATVASGTTNIGNDSIAGIWNRERGRVQIGADGQLVLKATFTSDLFDLRVFLELPVSAPIEIEEQASSPGTPATGRSLLYPKADGKWYSKGDDGVERGPIGAGGGFYLDTLELAATEGDDFDGASLNARWTPQGAFGADVAQYAAGGTWLETALRAGAHSIFQTMPSKETFEVIVGQSQIGNSGNIVGPAVVSSTGTGVCVGFRIDEALVRIEVLSAYAQSASGVTLSTGASGGEYARGMKHWWSIRRVQTILDGDIYVVRWSLNGFTWSKELFYKPTAFTPAKIGWGRFYGGAAGDTMAIDRFNVIDALDQGNNLLTTPVGGGSVTPTASSSFGGFGASRAIDGLANDWALNSGTTDNPPYWQAVWSVGQQLNRVLIKERPGDAFGIAHLELFNGTTTVKVPVRNHIGGSSQWHIVDFATLTGITQLKIVSDGGAGANGGFIEVEAFYRS